MSRDARAYLLDVIAAADSILRFVDGVDEARYASDDMLHSADRHGVMVLLIEEDGTIQRPHPMDADRRSEPNVMDRLTAAVDLPSWAKSR